MRRVKNRVAGFSAAALLLTGLSTVAVAAESPSSTQGKMSQLNSTLAQQNAELQKTTDKIASTGGEIEQSTAKLESSRSRVAELKDQRQQLESDLKSQRQSYKSAQKDYEHSVRSAYKGENLQGVVGVLDGVLGSGNGGASMIPRVLSQGKDDVQRYRSTSSMLQNTERQISQKQEEYEVSVERQRQRSQRLQQQKAALEDQVQKVSAKKQRSRDQIRQLKARQKAQRMGPPATKSSAVSRSRQLEIAREDIRSHRVEPILLKRYVKLYKEAAKEYGFGGDWYVLAAVGKVESNHGQNMGPSSAGALGPMQFLPSTWRMYGVDGNGDGEANIMDPEDAIPAAASYLKRGGAPEDWYSALYTYNHADWYVKEVLGVAESYRRMAGDNSVEPYI